MSITAERDTRLEFFVHLQEQLGNEVPPRVRDLREESMARFAELGFPTTRQEAWKFTNLVPIASTRFILAPPVERKFPAKRLDPYRIEGAIELVLVNGRLERRCSHLENLPKGLRIENLAEAWADPVVEAHLGRLADREQHPFVALNTALLSQGVLIHLSEGSTVEAPIHLLHVSVAGDEPRLHNPRVLIVAERNAQAAIVESWIGWGDGVSLTNAVTEIVAGDNVVLEHTKLLQESERAWHFATLEVEGGRDSGFTSHSISLGARLARNDLRAVLAGEGASAVLNGLYLLDGDQHLDNQTVIDHAKPHGTSRELYKGILDGRSRGIFEGRIIVRPDAQKTNAKQTNNNLILSREAIANTTPQLEIYADDVKCNHGSTIGRLDDAAIFYLRARGIEAGQARAMLTWGFVRELIAPIGVAAVRERLESMLLSRLPAPGEGDRP